MLDITLLPSAKVPLIYAGDTVMTTEWYRFFWNVYGFTGDPSGAIPVNKGGTGFTSFADHDLLIGNSIGTLDKAQLTGSGINITYAPGIINLAIGASGITPGTYGSASQVGVFTVNEYGILTNATNTSIAIDATQIISGTLPVIRGGTGQFSYTNGQLLIGNNVGNTLTKGTLGYGTGLLVTNGPGTINIDFSNAAVGTWAATPSSANLAAAMTDETGSGLLVFGTNPTLYNPNIDVIDFDTTYATTLTAGQLGWDGNNTLGIGMAGGNVIQHIGEDQFFYCKATSAITKGQVVMFTGAVGASGVPTGAPATGITDGTYIMGIAAESIAKNGFGLVQSFGTLRNVNTSGYADGDILWYNPSVTGGLTNTKPSAPNVKVQMAAVINGGSSGGGTVLIRINPGSTLGGTDSNAQITSPVNGNILTYDGTNAYWKNTVLTAGTGVTISTSSTGVLTISATGTGGTVTSVTGTAPISVATGTTTPVISISQATTSTNGYLSSTDWNTFNNKQPAGSYLTAVSVVSANGFAGTSSGGLTPALTLSTTITGLLKGNGTAISAATSGTDYAPATSGTSILYGNGAGGFSNVTIGTGVSFSGGTLSATGSGGTVTSVSGTGSVNGITLTGTVTSSGSLTLGGTLSGIGNSQLTNSTISGVALGGNLFNLTAGTGVSFSTGTTYNGSAAITINATGTGGTVTSVAALTIGTTGTDLSSTVANSTTTPVITLNVPTASATNRGALSSTDWSTFNGKQAALVSGTNIKTVSGVSLLGSGDVGTIGVGYGGTGKTSWTANGVLYASGTTTLTNGAALIFDGSRLGIGTASTNASLTQQLSLTSPQSAGGSHGIGFQTVVAGTDSASIKAYREAASYATALIFSTMTGPGVLAEGMRLDSNHCLIIGGTTNPLSAPLKVVGASQINALSTGAQYSNVPVKTEFGKSSGQSTLATATVVITANLPTFYSWAQGMVKIRAAGQNAYSGGYGGYDGTYTFSADPGTGIAPRDWTLLGTAATNNTAITVVPVGVSANQLTITVSLVDGSVPGVVPWHELWVWVEFYTPWEFTSIS